MLSFTADRDFGFSEVSFLRFFVLDDPFFPLTLPPKKQTDLLSSRTVCYVSLGIPSTGILLRNFPSVQDCSAGGSFRGPQCFDSQFSPFLVDPYIYLFSLIIKCCWYHFRLNYPALSAGVLAFPWRTARTDYLLLARLTVAKVLDSPDVSRYIFVPPPVSRASFVSQMHAPRPISRSLLRYKNAPDRLRLEVLIVHPTRSGFPLSHSKINK